MRKPGARPKLTNEQKKKIYELYTTYRITQEALGKRYRVAKLTINKAIKEMREKNSEENEEI